MQESEVGIAGGAGSGEGMVVDEAAIVEITDYISHRLLRASLYLFPIFSIVFLPNDRKVSSRLQIEPIHISIGGRRDLIQFPLTIPIIIQTDKIYK